MAASLNESFALVRKLRSTSVSHLYEATHPERPGLLLVEELDGLRRWPAMIDAFERDLRLVEGTN